MVNMVDADHLWIPIAHRAVESQLLADGQKCGLERCQALQSGVAPDQFISVQAQRAIAIMDSNKRIVEAPLFLGLSRPLSWALFT